MKSLWTSAIGLLVVTGGLLGLTLPFGKLATAGGVPAMLWAFVISCGAGGCNYWSSGKSGSARINDVRTKEALDTGAKKIATSCSFCLLMLQSSVPSDGPRRVFDIAELVAEALPDASTPAPVQEKAS